MEKTTNYEQFKFLEYNRDVNQKHVEFMCKIIQIKNRLPDFPILVNEKMEVVDGQHRLMAAKKLQLPIYYEVRKNFSEEDVFDINNCQKKWTGADRLKYWASLGRTDYLRFQEFLRKHDLTFPVGLNFARKKEAGFSKLFLEGLFEFSVIDAEEAEKLMLKYNYLKEYIQGKLTGNKKFLTTGTFQRAFIALTKIKSFNFDIFMRKLPYGMHLLRPCGLLKEYLKIFLNIYNWKNQSPLESNQEIKEDTDN